MSRELLNKEHLDPFVQRLFGEHASISSVRPIGQGFHASGYELLTQGVAGEHLFARMISPLEFGHDLPPARIAAMLEASLSMPHALPTHAVAGLTHDGTLVDLTQVKEVIAIAEFLPPGSSNFCDLLRTQTHSDAEAKALADEVQEKALLMAQAMVDIHSSQKFSGTPQEALSLYKRSLRAVIHNDELTAGVLDLIDFTATSWVTHEHIVGLLADMERVRHGMGSRPERLTRIHGDYWANNVYFCASTEGGHTPIITDGRLVWGEPAIDAGWMIGEFVMQDLVRFGKFGQSFTAIAKRAMDAYVERSGDDDIYRYMHLPYAFQAFAESYFTPDIAPEKRKTLVAVARGTLAAALRGEPFNLDRLNQYADTGSAEKRPDNNPKDFAQHVAYVINAHINLAKSSDKAVRAWDGKTPYAIHPVWCATMIQSETTLPADVRTRGTLTLLYHDVDEDTTASLPTTLPADITALIGHMTFPGGMKQEMEDLWTKPSEVLLYKLYDKVSNLMDGAWMSDELTTRYVAHTKRLLAEIERTYGRKLNIVRLAHAVLD
jgi:hypothetical protein